MWYGRIFKPFAYKIQEENLKRTRKISNRYRETKKMCVFNPFFKISKPFIYRLDVIYIEKNFLDKKQTLINLKKWNKEIKFRERTHTRACNIWRKQKKQNN
jgi:hypothetical protein